MNTKHLHEIKLPENYLPSPGQHLTNPRDCEHYLHTLMVCLKKDYQYILDIGCWDGWHPILLARDEFHVTGLEFIHDLAEAAKRYVNLCKLDNVSIIEADWSDITELPRQQYDLITCYEVLEHVPLQDVTVWITKMEKYAKTVTISLPNQKYEENHQHQWTPTENLIGDMFQGKSKLQIDYKSYPLKPEIPGNWFITYDTK